MDNFLEYIFDNFIINYLWMNREKYQLFDRSTNIIIASKTGTYTPYKATRFPLNKSSYKRIDPINIKLFDKPKRPQKILSRNDRIDLYL